MIKKSFKATANAFIGSVLIAAVSIGCGNEYPIALFEPADKSDDSLGPSTEPALLKAPIGTEVNLISTKGDWARVTLTERYTEFLIDKGSLPESCTNGDTCFLQEANQF